MLLRCVTYEYSNTTWWNMIDYVALCYYNATSYIMFLHVQEYKEL